MRFIDVQQGTAHPVEGAGYPVDVATLAAADVAMVVWPDDGGSPWIEREPFAGREQDAELLAEAETLMAQAQAEHDAPPPPPTLAKAQAARIAAMEAARKQAEAEGVTVNGIRYAGDPANRQALAEALDYADAAGIAEFAAWKDSDDRFHAAHPVADVRAALEQVGARRSQLIAREGERVASINDATDVATVEGITW